MTPAAPVTACPGYPFPARDGVDPDPGYALARATGGPVPVTVAPGRWAWLVTSMADVRTVHGDPRFSRAAATDSPDVPAAGLAPPAGSLLALDPPDHTRVRRLVAGAFSARRIAALRPAVAATARELLADLPADRPVDLVARYARPLSVHVIGDLLGVPAADHDRFTGWADAFLSTAASSAEVGRARGELAGFVGELLGRKAREPQDDLLSHLAGSGADPRETVMLAIAVLVAGHETTSNHLASSLLLVLSDPDVASSLRGRPEAVTTAVEELLRVVSLGAVGGFPRVALADVELSGVTVRAGETVIPALNAANRDPGSFDDPDRVDLARFAGVGGAGHVAFGSGAHHCLGAALARLELATGIATVLDDRPAAALATADHRWNRDSLVRGLATLPVRLGPAHPERGAAPCTAP
ncbi:cytochrome P450 [Actinomycetospora termitidis]|uniref:Cytochrome P450 n=1 Tax=Actinomycetospora termitidis TaxID=3053470 RepID=A0ABT7MFD3_9PSEU|nr:cytochrome P450 [Actinomycetospora sp. Odt1-22]MDL5158597.1 cytochrome P450 [Actinomycetospora sp. Odt1-22]